MGTILAGGLARRDLRERQEDIKRQALRAREPEASRFNDAAAEVLWLSDEETKTEIVEAGKAILGIDDAVIEAMEDADFAPIADWMEINAQMLKDWNWLQDGSHETKFTTGGRHE